MPKMATRLQAAARAMAPRKAFLAHIAKAHAARLAQQRAAREAEAASVVQAALRGVVQRRAYRKLVAELPAARRRPPARAV